MSLGRTEVTSKDVRDIAGDYLKAYIAEYGSYTAAGLTEKAADVAKVLKGLGHEVVKEKAVAPKAQKAVEANVPAAEAKAAAKAATEKAI